MAALLYGEIYLFCLVITGFLLFWQKQRDTNSSSEQWLLRVLVAFLVNFSLNLIYTIYTNIPGLPKLLPVAFALKTLYHLSLGVGVYCWCGFADVLNQGRFFARRSSRMATLLLLAVPVALALYNIKSRQLFDITLESGYTRGFLFHCEMGYYLLLSLAFSLPLLLRLPQELEPTRRASLYITASFPLTILAAWVLCFLGERVPVICVCATIELLCLYVDTSTRQISMDKLTQVNNRQNLLSFLEYKVKYHEESIFLLMIDVDYFKPINDTYGHLEGDEALRQISAILKRACAGYRRRPYIGRYGGDEFIIILEGTREEMENLCETIHTLLREYCEQAHKPYDLTVSIGVGRWHPDMTPQSFIAAADAQLYEIKHARKKPSTH